MLEDNDADFIEWEEEVRAKSKDEAETICLIIAENATKESKMLVTLQGEPQQVTRTPRNGKYRFVCKFRSEQ